MRTILLLGLLQALPALAGVWLYTLALCVLLYGRVTEFKKEFVPTAFCVAAFVSLGLYAAGVLSVLLKLGLLPLPLWR